MGGWHRDWVLLALNVWCPRHAYNFPRTQTYPPQDASHIHKTPCGGALGPVCLPFTGLSPTSSSTGPPWPPACTDRRPWTA